ncbi:cytochrome P450 [Microbispora sp. KK1-11]|uniref:cytochrome P450 n=1 Tax=Microbispora sp. KK1-11 TaxID=2053005 RepID=UPI00115A3EEB|nr:cytochrome P450 [Microbispora sp. KK1-11]TQS22298.1 cytochrome P450 [Microbispora sp. KK1-11]
MTDDLVTLILGHHALGLEESNKRGQALNAGFTYLRGLVEDRLATPRDDLISMMAHSEADGTHLSVSEVAVNALNLLAAGWETTSDALASIVATLLEHPQHWTAVARGEADVQAMASEALRYDGTSIGVMRTASADATIRGVRIKKGERLMLCFASGNQDSTKFEDPEQFMIERKHASPHLTFGHGIHNCVGAALAKLELVLMLESLARVASTGVV